MWRPEWLKLLLRQLFREAQIHFLLLVVVDRLLFLVG